MTYKRDAAAQKYFRQIQRLLVCEASTQKALLAGLDDEIAEALPRDADYAAIVKQFGSPDTVAAQLQETVGSEECAAAQKKKTRRKRWIAALVLTAIAAVVTCALLHAYYVFSHSPTYYTSEISEISEIPTAPSNS